MSDADSPLDPKTLSKKAARAQLFAGVHRRDLAVVEQALRSGASANDREPRGGDTAFLLSLRLGCFECAEKLWPGADPSLRGKGGQNFLMLAAAAKHELWARRALLCCDPAAVDDQGRDALRVACDLNYAELALLLLPVSDADRKDVSGQSALRSALARGSQSCALLLARASKNLDLHEPSPAALTGDFPERSLAQLAAEHGCFEAHELLVSLGAPDAPTAQGETALMLAASKGRSHFVQRALARSDPLARDAQGRDALMLAIQSGNQACCEALLPVSDLRARDASGRSLMELARENQSFYGAQLSEWLGARIERLEIERQTGAGAPAAPTRLRI